MIHGANIKPISDLNQYTDVLKDVKVGSPVYLTKNGHGKYVIFDIDDPMIENFEKVAFTNGLINELEEIERESDKQGWLKEEDVRKAIKALLSKND